MEWPEWWRWELEMTSHVLKRMVDRQFNEVDLRLMLERAVAYHEEDPSGRFVVKSRHGGRVWAVIVELSPEDRVLVVVTAFPIG
jgi:hypothetical protein